MTVRVWALLGRAPGLSLSATTEVSVLSCYHDPPSSSQRSPECASLPASPIVPRPLFPVIRVR